MFSTLCRYFYGVRGPFGRSKILCFAKRSSKNPEYSKTLLWLADAVYIAQLGNQGGHCISVFLRIFLQKLIFLSDQEVPGRHKNIYRELRRFFTTHRIHFELIGFLTFKIINEELNLPKVWVRKLWVCTLQKSTSGVFSEFFSPQI